MGIMMLNNKVLMSGNQMALYVPPPPAKGGDYNIVQTNDGDNCSLAITDANTFVLTTKTITENGTYNASADNADGYSQVTVNVASGVGVTVAETWVLNDELPVSDGINAAFAFLSNAGLYNYMGRFDNVFGASSMPIPGSDVILAIGQCALAYYKRGNSDSNSNPICDVVAIGTRIESDNPRLPTEWNDDKFKTIALSAPATGDVLAYLQSHAVKQ